MDAINSQVLVVDDELETRKLISALLQRIGIQCILVKDGQTALTLLQEGLLPSLIILDLMMPNMGGYEVLRRIRRMEFLDDIPVLILSNKAEPQIIRQGLEIGADAYVTKSYITNSLIDRVRVLIMAGRMPRQPTRTIKNTAPLQDPDTNSSPDDTPAIERPRKDSDAPTDKDVG